MASANTSATAAICGRNLELGMLSSPGEIELWMEVLERGVAQSALGSRAVREDSIR